MGCPSNRLKDSNAESNMGPVQDVIERQNINNLLREHSCDILTKNVAGIFCPCPKNLPEAKLNTIGLMGLTEEISRYPSISSVMWLLMITFMQICNKK